MTEPIGCAGEYLSWRQEKTHEKYIDFLRYMIDTKWLEIDEILDCDLLFISGIVKSFFGTLIYVVLSILLFIPDWLFQSYVRPLNILIFPTKFIINLFAAIVCYPFIIFFTIYTFAIVFLKSLVVYSGFCIYIVCLWGYQKESITPAKQQDIESGNTPAGQPVQNSSPSPPPPPIYSAPVVEKDTGNMECQKR